MSGFRTWVDRRLHRTGQRLTIVGARRRSPLLTSLGWVLRTRPVRPRGTRSRRTRGRRLAILHKVGGTEDVLAAFEARGRVDIGLLKFQRDDAKPVFHEFLGEALGDFDYRPHDATLDTDKQAYRTFVGQVIRHYCRLLGVRAFVAASMGYFAEREFAAACEALDIPFLALHKESIRTSAQRPLYERGLSDNVGPFTGRAIAVYNDDERTSQLRSGVVDPDRIAVVGCPRADVHHVRRRAGAPSTDRRVTYFAIDPLAGTRTFGPDADSGHTPSMPRWDQTASNTERALVAWARANPDVAIDVKVKLGRSRQVRKRFEGHTLPRNVAVHQKGVGTDFIHRAHVVVGLNSTVLLEALAAGRHVIVPRFGETASPDVDGFLFALDGTATEVFTEAEFAEALSSALASPLRTDLDDTTREVLDRYLGNPDGRASDRAHRWILREAGLGH